MSILKSFASAFLMYSRIPMPQVEWKEENRRYALCFFPLIGAVIGGLLLGLYCLCTYLGINDMIFSALAISISVVITGGIHMDGYMDVHDALACMGDKEKKLLVMKDSRVGAFAVIYLVINLILQFGCFMSVIDINFVIMAAGIYVISRALSGLAAVTFKSATGKGSLTNFTRPAYKNITICVEIVYVIITMIIMSVVNFKVAIIVLLTACLAFGYYKKMSYKYFGGITGDLAGYFLQLCELMMLLALTLGCYLI